MKRIAYWVLVASCIVVSIMGAILGIATGVVYLFTLLQSTGMEGRTAATLATFVMAAPTVLGIGAAVLLADRRARS